MTSHVNCPRCHLKIDDSRKNQNPLVCDQCGHVVSDAQANADLSLGRITMASLIAVALGLLIVLFQLKEWGGHMFEIRWLQLQEISGGSIETYERIGEICLGLQKHDCIEGAYSELARRDSKNWARLGSFQMRRAEYDRAVNSFAAYFRAGHDDSTSQYNYARALAEIGEYDRAQDRFEKILDSRPDLIQITVIVNYVKYMMDGGRYDQAAKVINRVRRQDDSKRQFMETEYQLIAEKKRSRS